MNTIVGLKRHISRISVVAQSIELALNPDIAFTKDRRDVLSALDHGIFHVDMRNVRFDPVVPSAGRPLLVVVSYPDGGTQPGSRVATLVRFPSSYPRGALYVNAFKADGTMLVRLANDETNAAAVRRVLANASRRLPFGEWSLAVVGTLALACGILWVAIALGIARGGR